MTAKAIFSSILAVLAFVGASSDVALARGRERLITFIGDSSTSALYSPPGYPVLVAKNLGVRIENLATLSEKRNVASYAIQDALAEQLPRLSPNTTDAVVFLGIDDLQWLVQGSETLSSAEAAYAQIIDALNERHIAIHLITVRNFSLDPNYKARGDAEAQAAMQRVTDALDNFIVNLGYPTLDIRAIPDLMDNASYMDGIHLSEVGLQRMSSQVTQWLTAPVARPDGIPRGQRRRVVTFIGDTLASDVYSPPGFPAMVELALQVPIHNLATPNTFISDILAKQIPKVPGDTTDAVIVVGTEDLPGLATGPVGIIDAESRIQKIVAALKARKINVYIIAPRDYSHDPSLKNLPANVGEWQARMKAAADQFADWEVALGYPTIDLRKQPDLLDASNYNDGHFSAQGMERVTLDILKWFQRCDASNKCVTIKSV